MFFLFIFYLSLHQIVLYHRPVHIQQNRQSFVLLIYLRTFRVSLDGQIQKPYIRYGEILRKPGHRQKYQDHRRPQCAFSVPESYSPVLLRYQKFVQNRSKIRQQEYLHLRTYRSDCHNVRHRQQHRCILWLRLQRSYRCNIPDHVPKKV